MVTGKDDWSVMEPMIYTCVICGFESESLDAMRKHDEGHVGKDTSTTGGSTDG